MDIFFNFMKTVNEDEGKEKKKIWGYCRISTPSQSITRQIRNIKESYPDAIICEEVYTGTKIDGRPKWEKLMAQVKRGNVDTIVFDSVSRLSRSKEEGSKLYLYLCNKGVNLVFLKEPFINTDVYKKALENQLDIKLELGDKATEQLMRGIFNSLNKYFLQLATRQVELAFEKAEKEVEDLRQRTKEGIEMARLNGKQIGRLAGTKIETRKAIRCKKIIRKRFEIFGGECNAAECARICNIARSTFYRYVNSILDEEGEKGNDIEELKKKVG